MPKNTIRSSRHLPVGEFQQELSAILDFWIQLAPDRVNGGFYGQIDNDGRINPQAEKGAVLNARILWTFSAAARLTGDYRYRPMAERAFRFLREKFTDKQYGGIFWSVDAFGNPLSRRKQIYAQAFGIYGYVEYYRASGDRAALEQALQLFEILETYAYDKIYGGYSEAFAEDWSTLDDWRLSLKDANEPKSMNTLLHILEAYTALSNAAPKNERVIQRVQELIFLFKNKIIDGSSGHMHLFFGMDWEPKSGIISYGHDIEASWLLWEAWQEAGDPEDEEDIKRLVLTMADSTLEALDEDGGLWYEYDPSNAHWVREKHWWPQAEALVGFYNAWQISGDPKWLEAVERVWNFITNHIIDRTAGEWFWGITENGHPMPGEDRAGFWKCPYHNSRALMELIRRHHS